jgi:D-arabinose 1-dehydrogenase-like Zn-dependent alcohol dehydrogenase
MSKPANQAVTFDQKGQFQWGQLSDAPLRNYEVEINVSLSTVNPIDTKRRYGYGRKVFQLKGADSKTLALGNDFVGIIATVGNGVVDLCVGDRVFGVKPPGKFGPHASRVVVKRSQAAKAHADLADELLVTLPYNACTVLRSLESIGVRPTTAKSKQILVCGASGGLGSIALGLLRQWGATVTAIDRAENHPRCLTLGAQAAYTDKDLPRLQGEFDAVLNFASWELDADLCRTLCTGALGYATTVHPMLSLLDKKGLVMGAIAAAQTHRRCSKNVPKGARYKWALFDVKAGDLELIQDFAHDTHPQAHVGIRVPMFEATLAFAHVEQMRPGRALLTNTTY